MITNVTTKSEKRTVKPDEQINIEPVVAIVKDLVTKSIEDGHIVFCEDVIRPFCITILCLNSLLFIDIFHIER